MTAVCPRLPGAKGYSRPGMRRVDPDLVSAVRQGTYVVDPHAVAAAILGRHEGPRLSDVLEALERDSAPVGAADYEAGPGADVA